MKKVFLAIFAIIAMASCTSTREFTVSATSTKSGPKGTETVTTDSTVREKQKGIRRISGGNSNSSGGFQYFGDGAFRGYNDPLPKLFRRY